MYLKWSDDACCSLASTANPAHWQPRRYIALCVFPRDHDLSEPDRDLGSENSMRLSRADVQGLVPFAFEAIVLCPASQINRCQYGLLSDRLPNAKVVPSTFKPIASLSAIEIRD